MKRGTIALILFMIGSLTFANSPVVKKDGAEYYMDYVRNRLVYTKVSKMPDCRTDFNEYLFKGMSEFIAEKKSTDTRGKIAFIVEPDGSIEQCWVIDPTSKAIDIALIRKIKNGAKYWSIGKHQDNPVPVEVHIHISY